MRAIRSGTVLRRWRRFAGGTAYASTLFCAMVTLAITGDVMLGRLVDRYVFADPSQDPGAVWGDARDLLAAADLGMMNLECVIGSLCVEWRRAPKRFNFGACPRAIEALTAVRTDCVSLASNHVLDYGADNLLEMLDLLWRARAGRSDAGVAPASGANPSSSGEPGRR